MVNEEDQHQLFQTVGGKGRPPRNPIVVNLAIGCVTTILGLLIALYEYMVTHK